MSPAAAEIPVERRANFVLGGLWFFRQERSSGHDHAAGAVAALRHLLLDERSLHRMRLRYRSKSLKGCDRPPLRARDCQLAGWGGAAIHHHRAGAALAEPATELGGGEAEAAQDVEERLIGVRRLDRAGE